MKIEYRYGNILNTDTKYIAQCVNAQGVMGAGLAKELRDIYPKVYEVYLNKYHTTGLKLGQVIPVDCGKHIIVNIVGQKYYGSDGSRYVDYPALRKGLQIMNRHITEPVSFPLIGCGLAGGDWSIVSDIIEEECTNFQPIVWSLDDEVPY